MADHYYADGTHGTGPRLATPGADDNCSATATLLLAASIFHYGQFTVAEAKAYLETSGLVVRPEPA